MTITFLVGFPLLDFTGCSHCKWPHITRIQKANETPYSMIRAYTIQERKWIKLFPGTMLTCKDLLFRLLPWNSFMILLNYIPSIVGSPLTNSVDAVFSLLSKSKIILKVKLKWSQMGWRDSTACGVLSQLACCWSRFSSQQPIRYSKYHHM